LRQHYGEFTALNTEIIAVSSDAPADAIALAERLALPFPLLSDVDLAVINAYGVFHADEPRGRRIARVAEFILDRAGTIRYAYMGEDYNDRSAVGELLDRLKGVTE